MPEIKVLTDFYGKEVNVEFDGTVYTSPSILNDEDLIAEWHSFDGHWKEN